MNAISKITVSKSTDVGIIFKCHITTKVGIQEIGHLDISKKPNIIGTTSKLGHMAFNDKMSKNIIKMTTESREEMRWLNKRTIIG